MKLAAKVIINTIDIDVAPKLQQVIDRLRRKLKKYKQKKVGFDGIEYFINCDDEIFSQIMQLKKKHEKDLELMVEYVSKYSDEELSKAVAFIPEFYGNHLGEYGDDNYTHEYVCDKCTCMDMMETLICNPKNLASKLKKEYAVCHGGDGAMEIYGI